MMHRVEGGAVWKAQVKDNFEDFAQLWPLQKALHWKIHTMDQVPLHLGPQKLGCDEKYKNKI